MPKFFEQFLENSVRIKLFFAASFIFFAIFIVSISFIINYNYENSYIKSDIKEKSRNQINVKIAFLKHHIDMHKFSLEALSSNYIFKNYLINDKDRSKVTALFEQIIASDNDVMQMRYIDENGMEKIRLERSSDNQNYKIIKDNALQNKKDRYYFQEVSKLTENSPIWVSDIDLNIENGKIQKPYIPTIRFAMPVFVNSEFKGIVILNVFMKKILDELTDSNMFTISLMDKDGEFLIGQYEIDGKLLDFSWSRYLLKKIDIKSFAPEFFNGVLHTLEFNSEEIHSKRISNEVGLSQDLILVLKVKLSKLEEIKDNTVHKIVFILVVVLLLSGPIGLLLAYIPSRLASNVLTAKKRLDEKSLIFDEYLEAMNVNNIISKSDPKGIITYVNNNFCKVSGYTKEEVIGKPHSLLRDPAQKKEVFKILWLTIQSGKTWKGILRNKKKDGSFYDVDIAIMPILNTQNKIVEYVAIRHDITELMA
jgi:PAS domain S-box-containing protein